MVTRHFPSTNKFGPLSSVVERITSNPCIIRYDEVASSILVAGNQSLPFAVLRFKAMLQFCIGFCISLFDIVMDVYGIVALTWMTVINVTLLPQVFVDRGNVITYLVYFWTGCC